MHNISLSGKLPHCPTGPHATGLLCQQLTVLPSFNSPKDILLATTLRLLSKQDLLCGGAGKLHEWSNSTELVQGSLALSLQGGITINSFTGQ